MHESIQRPPNLCRGNLNILYKREARRLGITSRGGQLVAALVDAAAMGGEEVEPEARTIGDAVGWGGTSGRALESLQPYGARFESCGGSCIVLITP